MVYLVLRVHSRPGRLRRVTRRTLEGVISSDRDFAALLAEVREVYGDAVELRVLPRDSMLYMHAGKVFSTELEAAF